MRSITASLLWFCMQASYYSYALKSLITISTIILLCLITAYHSVQAQVRINLRQFFSYNCFC